MRALPGVTPGAVALVFVGGAAGSALREAAMLLTGADHPLRTILAVNVAGALALGLLLEALSGGGTGSAVRRSLRLALGTGLCGGFTTYSMFAVQAVQTIPGRPIVALGYGLLTVVVGALATAAGLALGGSLRRGRGAAR